MGSKLAPLLRLSLIGLLSLCAISLKASDRTAQLRVGVVLPLTGEAAQIGQAMREGIELRLAESPESQIVPIFEDDQTANNVAAVSAAQKLIEIDHVQVLLNSVVNTVRPIAPIVARKRIPTLVIWDSNKTLANLSEWIYGLGISTEGGGQASAVYAASKLQLRRAAIISIDDEWSEIISGAFRDTFIELGGQIVSDNRLPLEQTDLRSVIIRLRNQKPDVIYFALFGSSRAAFLGQARVSGVTAVLMTADLFPGELQSLEPLLNGVYSTQPILDNSIFSSKYEQKYGHRVPPEMLGFAALGYDAVTLLENAKKELEAGGRKPNSEALQEYLSNAIFSGFVSLVDFSISRLSAAQPKLMVFKNGRLNETQDSFAE